MKDSREQEGRKDQAPKGCMKQRESPPRRSGSPVTASAELEGQRLSNVTIGKSMSA